MMNRKSVIHFISKSDIIKIVTATGLIFVLTNFLKVEALIGGEKTTPLFDTIYNNLALSADALKWLHKPWTIITFMFSSNGFINLLFDFIWLYFFGSVIEDLKGAYRVLPIYVVGGIVGGIFFMISSFIFDQNSILYLGILPSLFAVVVASVLFNPNYTYWFYGIKIKLWVLGCIFAILKLSTFGFTTSAVALILGGVLTGIFYNYGGITMFDTFTIWLKRIASFYGNNSNFIDKRVKPSSSSYLKVSSISEKNIDHLLDKISAKGMQALTQEEKKMLEKYSKEQ